MDHLLRRGPLCLSSVSGRVGLWLLVGEFPCVESFPFLSLGLERTSSLRGTSIFKSFHLFLRLNPKREENSDLENLIPSSVFPVGLVTLLWISDRLSSTCRGPWTLWGTGGHKCHTVPWDPRDLEKSQWMTGAAAQRWGQVASDGHWV